MMVFYRESFGGYSFSTIRLYKNVMNTHYAAMTDAYILPWGQFKWKCAYSLLQNRYYNLRILKWCAELGEQRKTMPTFNSVPRTGFDVQCWWRGHSCSLRENKVLVLWITSYNPQHMEYVIPAVSDDTHHLSLSLVSSPWMSLCISGSLSSRQEQQNVCFLWNL